MLRRRHFRVMRNTAVHLSGGAAERSIEVGRSSASNFSLSLPSLS